MYDNNEFWRVVKSASQKAPGIYFSPITWPVAWLKGILNNQRETVPTFWEWLNGVR